MTTVGPETTAGVSQDEIRESRKFVAFLLSIGC